MTTLIKLRRGTTAQWNSVNPILGAGEPGLDTTTGRLRIGNGTNEYLDLPIIATLAELDQRFASLADAFTVEKAQDAAAALFNAGTHDIITFTYDDAGNRIGTTVNIPPGYTDEQAQDAAAALLVNGTHTGVTFTYDDTGTKLNAVVSVPSYTDEQAQDAIAAMFAAGTLTGVQVVYDDAGNRMSFTSLPPTEVDGGAP